MNIKQTFGAVIAIATFVMGGCAVKPVEMARQTEIQFVNHIQAGMPEQDVFVAKNDDGDSNSSRNGYRMVPEDAAQFMDAPVYMSVDAQPHDPFVLSEKPFGPFEISADLGFTMSEWLAGTGSGIYTVMGDQAKLSLTFNDLVPNAMYTVWCPTIALPPVGTIIDEPCGAASGSENTFFTDNSGGATFQVSMSRLADSTDYVLRSIAIAYHSDGQSYGPHPGDFGQNSHVQLFAAIPGANSEAWISIPADQIVAGDHDFTHPAVEGGKMGGIATSDDAGPRG